MKNKESARRILVTAKTSLGDLVKASIDAGQFEEAAVLAKTAEGVSAIERDFLDVFSLTPAIFSPAGDTSQPSINGSTTSPAPTTRRKASRRKSKERARDTYPRFFREETRLVKVGWSRVQRAEYEHRAPKSVVDELIDAIVAYGGSFSMDKLLPLTDRTSEEELPSYQVYLSLAWLRSVELVIPKGRKGYSFNDSAFQDGALANHWNALPEK